MHPRLNELFGYIDGQHQQLRATYESVPELHRHTRPTPQEWSVADVIGHLTLVERRITGLFAMRIPAARAAGLAAETDESPVLPAIDLAPVLDRSRKIVSPDTGDPQKLPQPASWDEYEQAREQFKQAALAGDGLALSELTHPHPVFGSQTFYAWIAFVGAHATRHAAQIRETAERLPRAGP